MAKAHAVLSASGAKRWINCPGSIRLSAGVPRTSSEYARLGTAAHALAEFCLVAKAWDASRFKGGWVLSDETVIPPWRQPSATLVPDYDYPIDDDMVWAVNVYLETVKEELDRLSAVAGFTEVQLNVEKRFDLTWCIPGGFGTNDCSLLVPYEELVIVDYKHGQGVPVEVEGNEQLLYYALGAAHEAEWAFDVVTLIVVQPRCPHADGPVRRWTISADHLRQYALRLQEAAEQVARPDAPTKAGDWCRFCPAAGMPCPTLREAAFEAAALEFDEVGDPVEGPVAGPATDEADLARCLKAVPLLDAFAKSVTAEALRRLKSGEPVGDYKLVRKKANRAWRADSDPEEALRDAGIPEAKFMTEPKLRTPAQVERISKEAKALVAKLAHKPLGGITMAPGSDPREAVDPSEAAVADFTDVVEGGEE